MTDNSDMKLAKTIRVAGIEIRTASPPKGLVVREHLGILTNESMDGQVVHRTRAPSVPLFETRATITPGGDYLLMFPEGGHYGGSGEKVNDMLAYRSSDKGKTWNGPKLAFDIDYNQHGFVPLIPRGSKRIYAFGTQLIWGKFNPNREKGLQENAPIGFRYSDDDGHTWSDVTLIEPVNDPGFLGMSVMRMCETNAGTWLIGSHESDFSYKPLMTRQYILRSEDQGKTWTVLPHKRRGGWYVRGFNRMDEGRPINLGDGKVLLMTRTCEGHLWELRSEDDGKTWTDPKPTILVHPDAPPMLFHLADERTLVAFHHNVHTGHHFAMKDRSQIWVSISTDEGHTWSEPRFVVANALDETLENAFRNHQCSYIDMFADGDEVHLFVPHRWRQVLHLHFKESDLGKLPTEGELARG